MIKLGEAIGRTIGLVVGIGVLVIAALLVIKGIQVIAWWLF